MSSIVKTTRFEDYAFVWESAFETRQPKIYPKEDNFAVEQTTAFDTPIPLTSQIVIERFLEYRCDRDRDIYLYRNRRIESFLKGLDLECLRRGSTSDVNNPTVLLDDRSDLGVSTATTLTDSRPLREPLTAHQFYHELSKSVRCIHSLSEDSFLRSFSKPPSSCSRN